MDEFEPDQHDLEEAEEIGEDDSRDHLFGFYTEDHFVIQNLIGALRGALTRPDLAPKDIRSLARLLLALQCLPAPLLGFSINLSLGNRYSNGESRFDEFSFDDDHFEIGTYSYVILDESIGGDSVSDRLFECQVGGYREQEDPLLFINWAESFAENMKDLEQTLSIEDMSDEDTFDWDTEPDPRLWDDAPSDY